MHITRVQQCHMTCSCIFKEYFHNLLKIENITYNYFFTTKCNDISILFTIFSCDYSQIIFFYFWYLTPPSNITAISWRPVLVVEDAGLPGENHRPWTSNWKALSLATASQLHTFCNLRSRGRTHAALVCDYLNLSLANTYVDDVTIPSDDSFFSRRISQSDGSIQIKLHYYQIYFTYVERLVATRIYFHQGISTYCFSLVYVSWNPTWQYCYIYLIQ